MSFVKNQMQLAGSLTHSHRLRECAKCGHQKDPSGGIETRPGRWLCAGCWVGRVQKTNGHRRLAGGPGGAA